MSDDLFRVRTYDELAAAGYYDDGPPSSPPPTAAPKPRRQPKAATPEKGPTNGPATAKPSLPPEHDPAGLFDGLADFIGSYVIFATPEALVAVALWAAHSWAVDAFESSPRLALISPEKQSGKTRTLEVLELLCPNAMQSFNLTPAAIFRAIAADRPTLLFDEVDTIFGTRAPQHEELRGLLNAGHRNGQKAYRCVGDPKNMKVEAFPAFCAVALAGIGDLPDTIIDRSIVVKMRRRAPGESVRSFRARLAAAEAAPLAERLGGWAQGATEELAKAWPDMPAGLVDRPADVWAPLLAIADHAGGHWPARARDAALKLNADRQRADTSLGVRLLADVRALFVDTGNGTARHDQLATDAILEHLNNLEEAPWGDLRGKPLDSRGLARRLRRYDVAPTQIWLAGAKARGYRLEDLHDAFARYLTPLSPQGTVGAVGAVGTEPSPRWDDAARLPDLPDLPLAKGTGTPNFLEQWYGDDTSEDQ